MTRPSHLFLIGGVFLAGAFAAMATARVTADHATALVVGLVALLTVSASVHLMNEAADHATDARTQRTRFSGGSGRLARAELSPRVPMVAGAAIGAVGIAIGTGGSLLGVLPGPAWLMLVSGLVLGWAYSVPPIELSHRGFGELDNAFLGGLLLPLYGFATVSGVVTPLAVVVFLPFALTDFANVIATAWPDRHADASVGKLTLAVRLTVGTLRRLHGAVSVSTAVSVVAAIWLVRDPALLPTLLTVPLLAWAVVRFTRQESPAPSVAAMLVHAGTLLLGWGAAMLA